LFGCWERLKSKGLEQLHLQCDTMEQDSDWVFFSVLDQNTKSWRNGEGGSIVFILTSTTCFYGGGSGGVLDWDFKKLFH